MKYFIAVLVLLLSFSCQKNQKPSYGKMQPLAEIHPGKKIMENKCYACHNPTTSQSERVAPPMIAIKKHYILKNTSKEEFIISMQNWIKNPTEENAKMYGAVKKFGIMPKQFFSEEDIKLISEYLFENDIEKPEWFESHYNEEKGKGNGKGMMNGKKKGNPEANLKELSYAERGLQYALSTKTVLGKNLMGKIQKEGTLAALKFCNENALTLTDSMAMYHNARIQRVSDKPRNPKNKANIKELAYIAIFKDDAKSNKQSEPIVVKTLEKVNVYYPIKTNGMCLQCHGNTKTQVAEKTFSELKKLYPDDKALGYDINQVRGIWNVSFSK